MSANLARMLTFPQEGANVPSPDGSRTGREFGRDGRGWGAEENPLGSQLEGELGAFSPFELLQYLQYLRKSGRLELLRSDGAEAFCCLVDGAIVRSQCGHISSREAVLTLVWWKEGRFRFYLPEAPEQSDEAMNIEELMMEAVRLADELERREDLIPQLDQSLSLGSAGDAPEDQLGCGIEQVWQALEKGLAGTRRELEELLPLCPVKVRLALAEIAEAGALGGVEPRAAAPAEQTGTVGSWWAKLQQSHPTGLRVLVAHAWADASSELAAATRSLADGLGSPTLATAVVPFGPSFLRFRPVHGGVLSVSLLPISRKNRFLFESLLDSVDAVIVSGWSEAGSEAEDWTALIPQGLDLEILDETGDLGAELAAVLRRRAEGEIR